MGELFLCWVLLPPICHLCTYLNLYIKHQLKDTKVAQSFMVGMAFLNWSSIRCHQQLKSNFGWEPLHIPITEGASSLFFQKIPPSPPELLWQGFYFFSSQNKFQCHRSDCYHCNILLFNVNVCVPPCDSNGAVGPRLSLLSLYCYCVNSVGQR